MAGHSKWANIKHRKAAQDAKRGKIFTKLIREITTSARLGDPDPANNPRLRAAVTAALTNNMTRDTINRAIQRGAGGGDGEQLETIVYEGYGPAGSAVMVECLTDNRNRTVAEVRHAFSKCGGNLGTDGSVAYLFSKKGLLTFVGVDEDALMDAALEAGADDVESDEEGHWIYCADTDLNEVAAALEAALGESETTKLIWKPQAPTEITDLETAQKLMKLIDTLEDDDDVQNVTGNFDLSEEVAAQL